MRILVADDHHVVREALVTYLTRIAHDISCSEASNLDQVKERIAAGPDFDIILLDYHMPGMNGLGGFDAIRGLVPDTPVAIMSGSIDQTNAVAALERGAAGILMKDIRGTALLNALRLIAAGEVYVPAALLGAGRSGKKDDRRDVELRALLGNLTRREFDCLQVLARGSTNREIAEQLGLAEITVKLHLNSMFKKMGARNRSDAVRIALQNGINAL